MTIYMLVNEYHESYSTFVRDALIFSSKIEINEYLNKHFTNDPIEWKTSTFKRAWTEMTEIEYKGRQNAYNIFYIFERKLKINEES